MSILTASLRCGCQLNLSDAIHLDILQLLSEVEVRIISHILRRRMLICADWMANKGRSSPSEFLIVSNIPLGLSVLLDADVWV